MSDRMEPSRFWTPSTIEGIDELLETLQRDTFAYFLDQANPANGLVSDTTKEGAPASIAVVGFALAAYPVGVERGFWSRAEAVERTLTTLRFFWNGPQGTGPDATGYQGFYYHFLHMQTGRRVSSLADLPPAAAVLFDLTPRQVAAIAGDRLDTRARRRFATFRYGPGSFKIDYALDGPVPWKADECGRAGSVHVGGTLDEVVAAERDVAQGRHPERPFLLTSQPSRFDPSRAPAGKHTFWAYCHVPHGSTVDMTAAIEDQLERFAPGFRDLVLARHTMFPADLERHNANNVGGDVAGGSHGGLQLVARPRLALDPYRLPIEGVDAYLCSASTPPGAGVHGMCGWWAARSALNRLESRR